VAESLNKHWRGENMKNTRVIAAILALGASLTSCQSSTTLALQEEESDVLEQVYVHKYGVSLDKGDWESRGQDGQVINKRPDGVIVTKTYRKGILDGVTTYSFPHNDVVQKVEYYQNGKSMKEQTNYPSGIPMREEEIMANGYKKVTHWYESSSPSSVEEVLENLLVTGRYYTVDNTQESHVKEGYGTRPVRSSYGDLIAHDVLVEGEVAERTLYFPNGAVEAIVPYSKGIVSGKKKTYLLDGEPCTIEEWAEGKRNGMTLVYQNGEKISEIPYKNGKKNGVERRFRNGTTVEEEITWREDMLHGPVRSYAGNQMKTDWYNRGKVVSHLGVEDVSGTIR
jgi:antitoxin component YwqK of YwqJK toxin-antitoxin module